MSWASLKPLPSGSETCSSTEDCVAVARATVAWLTGSPPALGDARPSSAPHTQRGPGLRGPGLSGQVHIGSEKLMEMDFCKWSHLI